MQIKKKSISFYAMSVFYTFFYLLMLKFSLVINIAFQVYTSIYCYSGRVCFKKI